VAGYRLRRRVGLGGMAEVWLAERDGIPYALKALHPNLSADAEFRDMFRDETELARAIDHPHVVRVLELFETAERQIQVMEWIDGRDLNALEVQLEREGGRFPEAAAVFMVASVARGLEAAHRLVDADGRSRELVHRDVAPPNIMVGRDGAVKLLDFGVAKARARLTQTAHGVIKGRIGYMAPEQALGEELTPQADVYALGVVAWELLAMERLFPAGGDLVDVIQRRPPRRLKGVRAEVADLVMRMLHPDPNARATVEAVIDGLSAVRDPAFDFAAWCRSVFPARPRGTAVFAAPQVEGAEARPAERARPDPGSADRAGREAPVARGELGTPDHPDDRTAPDPPGTGAAAAAREPTTIARGRDAGGGPTEPTVAASGPPGDAGPRSDGPETIVDGWADDATSGAAVEPGSRIRGLDPTDPTDPLPAADGAWVHSPVGLSNPQSFEQTRAVAVPSVLCLPEGPPRAPRPPDPPRWAGIAVGRRPARERRRVPGLAPRAPVDPRREGSGPDRPAAWTRPARSPRPGPVDRRPPATDGDRAWVEDLLPALLVAVLLVEVFMLGWVWAR